MPPQATSLSVGPLTSNVAPAKSTALKTSTSGSQSTYHRIPCSSAVALTKIPTTYRIPKKTTVASKPLISGRLPAPLDKDVSKDNRPTKPAVKLNSNNNKAHLPLKDKKSMPVSTATSGQLSDRSSNLPKPSLLKKPVVVKPLQGKSGRSLSSDKKSKEKNDAVPHVPSSSNNNKSDQNKHISTPSTSKHDKSKPEIKKRTVTIVDIFAPPSQSTKTADPKVTVFKEGRKEAVSDKKSSKPKSSGGKDSKEPTKQLAPPVVSCKDKETTNSKSNVSKSDPKKKALQATSVNKKDSRSNSPATKEKTVPAPETPATHKDAEASSSLQRPAPKPSKEPEMVPAPFEAKSVLETESPTADLLRTLMGVDEVQPANSSRSEPKVAAEAPTQSTKSKQSDKGQTQSTDEPVVKKSKLSWELSLPKKIQKTTSDSLPKSAAPAARSEQAKTESVLSEKVTIDLKIADKKKLLPTAETKLPSKTPNSCTPGKENSASSSEKVASKLSLKRRRSSVLDVEEPLKMLILTEQVVPVQQKTYVVMHTEEEKSKPKSRKPYEQDDDEYQPSTSEAEVSACELTSECSTSSASCASRIMAGYKTRGRRSKGRKKGSASSSSDSESDFAVRKKDRLKRRTRKRDKQEREQSRKDSGTSKRSSSGISKVNRRRILQGCVLDSSDFESEEDTVAKKRKLSSMSPQPSTSGLPKQRVRPLPPTDSDDDQPMESSKAPPDTPLPSTDSKDDHPSNSKSNDKETPVAEPTSAALEPEAPVVAKPELPPQVPDFFELSDDDLVYEDELCEGSIEGEQPGIIDVYNCIAKGMEFVIASTCKNLVVCGNFTKKMVEPPPLEPVAEEVSEVIISQEPEDDEVVSYVRDKKLDEVEVIDLDSDEDPRPLEVQIESSPSPEPMEPSPTQVSLFIMFLPSF